MRMRGLVQRLFSSGTSSMIGTSGTTDFLWRSSDKSAPEFASVSCYLSIAVYVPELLPQSKTAKVKT